LTRWHMTDERMGGTKCRPLCWDRNRVVFGRLACGEFHDFSTEADEAEV